MYVLQLEIFWNLYLKSIMEHNLSKQATVNSERAHEVRNYCYSD